MATWPYTETSLTDVEKNAYRYLLYRAMLDIRDLCQSRGPVVYNPLEWWRQYLRSRDAGRLADWLHNLANYASKDFVGFNEEWFWKEYDGVCRRSKWIGPDRWMDYRKRYEERKAGRNVW